MIVVPALPVELAGEVLQIVNDEIVEKSRPPSTTDTFRAISRARRNRAGAATPRIGVSRPVVAGDLTLDTRERGVDRVDNPVALGSGRRRGTGGTARRSTSRITSSPTARMRSLPSRTFGCGWRRCSSPTCQTRNRPVPGAPGVDPARLRRLDRCHVRNASPNRRTTVSGPESGATRSLPSCSRSRAEPSTSRPACSTSRASTIWASHSTSSRASRRSSTPPLSTALALADKVAGGIDESTAPSKQANETATRVPTDAYRVRGRRPHQRRHTRTPRDSQHRPRARTRTAP